MEKVEVQGCRVSEHLKRKKVASRGIYSLPTRHCL